MKKILVLTDFSSSSINAYGYAVKMACQLKAEILLLFSTNGEPLSLTNQFQYSQQLHSFAKRYACDTRRKLNPHHTECLISGDPWVSLLPSMAAVHVPDLIIAGSELLGSMEHEGQTVSLQELSGCPVLWIPEKASYQPWQNLVFVTDFTDQEPVVISRIKVLAKDFGAKVSAVHFYSKADRRNLVEIKKKGLELNKEFDTVGTSHMLEEEDMLEGLQEFAEQQQADAFIIATRDLHLTQQYLHHVFRKTNACLTSIPLLSMYQDKKKPCTGSCLHCQELREQEETSAVV